MKKTIIILLVISFLFISIPSVLLLRYKITGKHKKWIENKLSGVVIAQEFPSVSAHDFLDGKFQKAFSKWFQENVGLRELFIRTNNQIYYSAFNKSYQYSGNIIIGKGYHLYEKYYIDDYINEIPSMSINDQNDFVLKIKKVQELFDGLGIRFILLITPSKAYTYPEYIPDEFLNCKQGTTTYDSIVPLLMKAGINMVDGQRIILDQKKSVFPMFPRGGTHWSYLGAYYVSAELIAMMEKTTKRRIPELKLNDVETQKPPEGFDKDLAELLNLIYVPLDFIAPVPRISVYKDKSESKDSDIKVSIIGGSFTEQPYGFYRDYSIFNSLYKYYYYVVSLTMFPKNQILDQTQYNPRTNEWWSNNFLNNDVIILEINQSNFAGNHVQAFLDDALHILPGSFPNMN